MKLNEINSNELLEIYNKINEFENFLNKEEEKIEKMGEQYE